MDTDAQARADATFEKKEKRAVEANAAWADYKAEQAATEEKTARLRALRLAREAQAQSATPPKSKQQKGKVRRVRAR
jgi:hypothetical protein